MTIRELAIQAGLLRIGDGWTEPGRWGESEIIAFAELVQTECTTKTAAPELLVALEGLLHDIKMVDALADYGLELQPAIYQANKAIELAKGRVWP